MRMLIIVLLAVIVPESVKAIDVFACEPEWASLVRELTEEDVSVTVATTAFQDPHRLQARPSLIAAVRNADLVVCTGADLEIGWLPLLLRRAGNPDVQAGKPGLFLAADFVRKLEIPQTIDRAQGDIHPQGNPHVHLHPRNIARIADALGKRLGTVDPANAARYDARLESFQARWDDARDAWELRADALRGMRLASHHKSFSYLADWLGLDIVATLESKPGIPPSGAQLATLLETLTANPPLGVIRTPYENEKPSLWLSERLGVPAIELPYTIGGTDSTVDLFTLYEQTLAILEAHVR